ncbi:hypothetical protein HYH02_005728 [Chlamydomonas schloesseri]|uniref:dolichyl-phosphate-mannose--protein mannosyltransferase n=1 Tax=Chlamydomonas schloesseri TaxID=2026947 RepID=A0A836B6S7_9CHLO|nr:hypothetical protein HYH02_005728 [Chlamydomonas schloesseri]|eukprot:KAG2448974.1 hypothetical protein HYH02_005728 [Chlamydomonas schloesseri]
MKAETAGALVCALVGALVYVNTIPANFTFDDSFAVVYNGDVTQDSNPLWGLLQHDFWGQRIASDQSHKSFRPLTVLSFRLTRQAWSALPQRWRDAVLAYRSRMLLPDEDNEGAKRGLDPLLFHCCNVAWHALVSGLVCRLCYFLLLRRWSPTPLVLLAPLARTASSFSGKGAAAAKGAGQRAADAADTLSGIDSTGTSVGTSAGGNGPGLGRPSQLGLRKRGGATSTAAAPDAAATPTPWARQGAAVGAAGCCTRTGTRTRHGHDAVVVPWLAHSGARCPPSDPSPSLPPSSASPAPRSSSASLLRWPLSQLHVPAWFAGLAFATHPVHTEAVAGVVGQAELLCAALSIPAIMVYVSVAERAAAARLAATGSADARGAVGGARWRAAAAHWGGVAAATCLALAAALAKEIGITVLGFMLAADAVLVPLVVTAPPPRPKVPQVPGHMQQERGRQGQETKREQEQPSDVQRREDRMASEEADEGRAGGNAQAGSRRSLAARLARMAVWATVEEPKWLRLCVLVAAGLGYVKMRSAVAVDQLVRIYRKVENPIPFSTSPAERLLTTAHLHARYAGLLLWPQHLSADWSFACVPLVSRLQDPRNALSAALYAYLLAVALAAAPWGVLADWARALAAAAQGSDSRVSGGKEEEEDEEEDEEDEEERCQARGAELQRRRGRQARLWGARWRLLVVAGLLVGPYFPASNVLFYVGTFIGERLLYFPSIGYCLLLAELAALALGWAQGGDAGGGGGRSNSGEGGEAEQAAGANHDSAAVASQAGSAAGVLDGSVGSSHASSASGSRRSSSRGRRGQRGPAGAVVRALVYCAMAATLAGYSWRTWARNADWLTEERLFEAANRVCGDSAKVQLNMGILQRRKGDQAAALGHFRRARAIEPGYCEPAYWIGVTLINLGQPEGGLAELEAALSCKYVAAEAVKSLNTIFRVLHNSSPRDPTPILRWGLLLLRPELGQLAEGCDMIEQAAAMYAAVGRPQEAEGALGYCASAVRRLQEEEAAVAAGGSPAAEVAREVFGIVAEAARKKAPAPAKLLRCLEARTPLYRAVAVAHSSPALRAAAGKVQPAVRAATYRYLRQLEAAPYCRRAAATMALGGAAQVGSTPPHLHLLHMVQSSDPEDPWLQAEWGRVLLEVGRGQEAVMHLSVAAVLLHQQLERLQAGQRPTALSLELYGREQEEADPGEEDGLQGSAGPGSRAKKKGKKKGKGKGTADSSGASATSKEAQLTVREVLQGVARSLEDAARQRPPNACEMWGQAVEARRMLAVQALGGGNAAEYGQHQAALVAALGELQGLVAAGAAQPQCAAALSAAMGLRGGGG